MGLKRICVHLLSILAS
ncbi:hypothetical protein [Defluviitalea saccharophila]